MKHTDFLIHVYVTLLRLYPIQFRFEFEEEMQTVFANKVMDQANADQDIMIATCLCEYFALLYNLPYEYVSELGIGGDMSSKGRIFFILSGCLFLAGGVFPWASVYVGSTVENFKGANEILLFLTGGAVLVASLTLSQNLAKLISIMGCIIGLGWGVYIGFGLISYFTNPPHFPQNSDYMNLGPGLFFTMAASILLASYGIFKLSSINKRLRSG